MANIQNDGAGVLSAPQNKEKSSGFARWIKKWNGHPFSALTELLVWLSGIAMMLIMLFLVGFILVRGIGHLSPELFSFTYNSENASLMPALVNTLIITALSLLMAIPFGVFTAIYLVEYAKKGRDTFRNSFYYIWSVRTAVLLYGSEVELLPAGRCTYAGHYDSSADHPHV